MKAKANLQSGRPSPESCLKVGKNEKGGDAGPIYSLCMLHCSSCAVCRVQQCHTRVQMFHCSNAQVVSSHCPSGGLSSHSFTAAAASSFLSISSSFPSSSSSSASAKKNYFRDLIVDVPIDDCDPKLLLLLPWSNLH